MIYRGFIGSSKAGSLRLDLPEGLKWILIEHARPLPALTFYVPLEGNKFSVDTINPKKPEGRDYFFRENGKRLLYRVAMGPDRKIAWLGVGRDFEFYFFDEPLRVFGVTTDLVEGGRVHLLDESQTCELSVGTCPASEISAVIGSGKAERIIHLVAELVVEDLRDKDHVPLGVIAPFKRWLETRESLDQVLSIASESLGREVGITTHGIFFPMLEDNSELVVRRIGKLQSQFGDLKKLIMPIHGTLLGLRRSGKLIKNDDDIDLLLLPNSPRISDWDAALENFKAILSQCDNLRLVSQFYGHCIIKDERGYPFDVFLGWWQQGAIKLHSYRAENNEYLFPPEWLYDGLALNFGDVDILVPQEVDLVLEHVYGASWRIEDKYFCWPWELKD